MSQSFNKNKIVIGINAYHADSAACLIVNGKLVAAIEEERINRIKHWSDLLRLSNFASLN